MIYRAEGAKKNWGYKKGMYRAYIGFGPKKGIYRVWAYIGLKKSMIYTGTKPCKLPI